jgi:hypothetical protein
VTGSDIETWVPTQMCEPGTWAPFPLPDSGLGSPYDVGPYGAGPYEMLVATFIPIALCGNQPGDWVPGPFDVVAVS